ncbi:polyphosphate polymerase domain-containing protein [Ruminococcaceae bacterium OttesenSCG-928-A16]|nr:polyphosphate polymerase domain-containing protein [Ruminococcaceae bacterium OttesenSCG-928-A16]
MEQPKFRHELKYSINMADWLQLRSRLRLLAKPDENAGAEGSYTIRSLYFDNYADKAVTEKLAGVSRREKFRLRYYNGDISFIKLEKKSKVKSLINKQAAGVSATQCAALLKGQTAFLLQSNQPLLCELYEKMQSQQLRPKIIVDYEREAYVYAPGNVRVTIDSNIRTSNHVNQFLNPGNVTMPAAAATILEVKFDEFLPDIIRDIIQLKNRSSTEFSKYVVTRLV